MSGLLYVGGHFPFCQTDFANHPAETLDEVTTDGFPVESTLLEFGEWFWKVRTWRIQMSGSAGYVQTYYAGYTEPDPPYDYSEGPWVNSASISLDLDVTTDALFGATEARKLVCLSAWDVGSAYGSGTTFVSDTYPPLDGGYDASFNFGVGAGSGAAVPRWRMNAARTKLFPRLVISGDVTIGPSVVASWSTVFEEEDVGSGYHYQYSDITFAGHTTPIQLFWNDYFGEVASTVSFTLSIEPEDVYL